MRPVNSLEATVSGNLDGERIKMGIGQNAEDVIIAIVTDLYSDPEMAAVREYSTNARDSHIEAGKSDVPIQVSTPTELSPYLIIRDEGLGLSIDDIKEIYSQYGESTKRDSNDFNGMLGLGSKSALAYTEQFTVTARKNGMQSQVIVTRDEQMRPIMEVMDTRGTDAPNGVEIKIPAKYGSNIERKAKEFFRFWNPDTVLLNGKAPETVFSQDFKKLTDTVYSFPRLEGDYIVMGNVAYKLADKALTESYGNNNWYAGTVAWVDMGDIAFPPSRESVAYTPLTKRTIARIVTEIKTSIHDQIIADIASATSHAEAFRSWKNWMDLVGDRNVPSNITYRGDKFIQRINNTTYIHYDPNGGRYNSGGTRAGRVLTNHAVHLETLVSDENIVIEGFVKTDMSSTDKQKVKKYASDNNLHGKGFILFDDVPGAPWTDGIDTIHWDVIKAIKLNRGEAKTRGLIGSIPIKLYKNGVWENLVELDEDAPIYYLSPSKDERWSEDDVAINIFWSIHKDAQIIKLGKNRWDKLVREFPTAKHIDDHMFGLVEKVEATLTANDKRVLRVNSSDAHVLNRFGNFTIDDPELTNIMADARLDKTRADLYNRVLSKFGTYDARKKYSESPSLLAKNYPLMSTYSHNRVPVEHEVIYINAVYAAKNKESK